MQRIDKGLADIERKLSFLASSGEAPQEARAELIPIYELVSQARNKLKIMMIRGSKHAG